MWCICGQKPRNCQIFETLIATVTGPLKAFEAGPACGSSGNELVLVTRLLSAVSEQGMGGGKREVGKTGQ